MIQQIIDELHVQYQREQLYIKLKNILGSTKVLNSMIVEGRCNKNNIDFSSSYDISLYGFIRYNTITICSSSHILLIIKFKLLPNEQEYFDAITYVDHEMMDVFIRLIFKRIFNSSDLVKKTQNKKISEIDIFNFTDDVYFNLKLLGYDDIQIIDMIKKSHHVNSTLSISFLLSLNYSEIISRLELK